MRGFYCHQALICVRLVSEEDLFALCKDDLLYKNARPDGGRGSDGL